MTTATNPARYASWSPARNDSCAAATICSSCSGYCWARSAALAYESWSWTLGRGRDILAGGRDRGAHGRRVAGRKQGPEDRGHQRTAEVALQVGRARSHADTGHRHRARERVGRRGAGQPDADPHEDQRDGHEPVRCPLAPQEEHADERKAEEGLAKQQRDARAALVDEARGTRGHEDEQNDRRKDGRASCQGVVTQDVLQVLLVDEGDAHERAEDDDAGHRRHPERSACRDREVVRGGWRCAAGAARRARG